MLRLKWLWSAWWNSFVAFIWTVNLTRSFTVSQLWLQWNLIKKGTDKLFYSIPNLVQLVGYFDIERMFINCTYLTLHVKYSNLIGQCNVYKNSCTPQQAGFKWKIYIPLSWQSDCLIFAFESPHSVEPGFANGEVMNK